MALQQIILFALQASIMVTVFGFGLAATKDDLLYVVSRPGLFGRSVLAMFVVMPVLAVALAKWFDFRPEVEIAIVALAFSPIPPLLPRRQDKAAGRPSHALGLMVTMALLSIAIIPLSTHLLSLFYGQPFAMGPGPIARLILLVVILPLFAGIVVHALIPRLAQRIARPALLVAGILLPVGGVAILIASAHVVMALIGNGTLVVILAFIVAGLAVGHALGGPAPEDRAVLALSTATRHPGIAMTVTAANYPGDHNIAAAILLYFVLNIAVSIPYVMWQRRRLQPAGA